MHQRKKKRKINFLHLLISDILLFDVLIITNTNVCVASGCKILSEEQGTKSLFLTNRAGRLGV